MTLKIHISSHVRIIYIVPYDMRFHKFYKRGIVQCWSKINVWIHVE